MARSRTQAGRPDRWDEATWVAVGAGTGAALGVALGGGAGVALGVAVGAGVGLALGSRRTKHGRSAGR